MKSPKNLGIVSPKTLRLTILLIIGSRLSIDAQETLTDTTIVFDQKNRLSLALDTTSDTSIYIGYITETLRLLTQGANKKINTEVPMGPYCLTKVIQEKDGMTMMKKGHIYSYGPIFKGNTEWYYVIEENIKDRTAIFSCQGKVNGESKVINLILGKRGISEAREESNTLHFIRKLYRDGNTTLAYTTFKKAFGGGHNKVYDAFVITGDVDIALQGLKQE